MLRKNKHKSGSGTADRPTAVPTNKEHTQHPKQGRLYRNYSSVKSHRERAQCVLYVLSWRYEHKQFGIRSIKGKVPHEALVV